MSPPVPSPPAPRTAGLSALRVALPVWGTLLLIAAALVGAAWVLLEPTPDKHLVIATGPERGAYDDFARRYQPLLAQHGVSVRLRATAGSAENLRLLREPGSGVHAAFLQGGALATPAGAAFAPALAGTGAAVQSLGSVAVEPLWIFVREDSAARLNGGRLPQGLAALAGWRIDTGPPGGGTEQLFRQLAAESGLALPAVAPTSAGAPAPGGTPADLDGVLALVSGRIDALALVSAAEAPLVQYLLGTSGVRPVGLPLAEAYARRLAFLRPQTLPRGTIDPATLQPTSDLPLVATTATLAVRADLHPALVQLLLQAAQKVHGEAGWFQRAGDFPQPSADELPLAPAAARHYRSGPPWLQQYLPFWLANFIDRMWIVLLPLLAALVPLSRILPPLVTMRLRSRVYRWYGHLRAIESELEAPGADLAALRQRLEQLDLQTENIGLPLSFTNELYDLRGHIHLVRKRLQARAGGPAAAASAAAVENAPAT
ncbi:hypothetical protein IP87_13030 [beta proteobacterium AAP121]|nr:hypothetical protein IP80_03360 [beta proteobacterium AAP65]KPF96924.1 hypothetical protein IP87_13030 [beta proteobacterium AAP121]